MLAIGLLLVLILWSTQPSGRWLVEASAAWLSRVGGWRLALAALSLVAIVAAVHVLDAEGVLALGYTVGEAFAWFVAFDVATWVEVYSVIWLLGARRVIAEAVRQVRSLIAAGVRRVLRSPAPRAPRIQRPPRQPGAKSADDEPTPWGLAMAA